MLPQVRFLVGACNGAVRRPLGETRVREQLKGGGLSQAGSLRRQGAFSQGAPSLFPANAGKGFLFTAFYFTLLL